MPPGKPQGFFISPSSFSPQRESRALTMRQRVYDNEWTPASHPARHPGHNLHYTQQGLWIPAATRMDRARVGLPDPHLSENNSYQVTSSYLPLHGPERGHRNANNELALGKTTGAAGIKQGVKGGIPWNCTRLSPVGRVRSGFQFYQGVAVTSRADVGHPVRAVACGEIDLAQGIFQLL